MIQEPNTIKERLGEDVYTRAFAEARGMPGGDHKPLSTVQDGKIVPLDLKVPALNPITAYELDALEMPPINWIVDGLIAKGNVILFGAPSKYFKSYLVLGMLIAICNGKSYLGFTTHRCECLYLDLESTRRRPKARLNQIIGEGKEKPKGLHIITGAENKVMPIGKGFREQMCAILEAYPGIGIVVIDVFGKIRFSKGKQDAYEHDYRDISELKAIANDYDVAILLVHHTTKMKRSDPFDDITGSVGLVGAADGAWTITKDNRAALDGVFHITGRDIETSQINVSFNKETFKWEREPSPEELQYRQLLSDYEKSNVVKTLHSILIIPGKWEGSTGELIKASYSTHTPIHFEAREVGLELNRFKELLEMEGITFNKHRESKGWIYTFHKEY